MALSGSVSGSNSGKILKRADPSTIQDKFLVGYQGWFTCPNDGAPVGPGHHGWLHWLNQPLDAGGRPMIDIWPDVSSYSESELFTVPQLKFKTGEPASLFSSRHPKTVQRHFNWMAQHGVDGAFLQRFVRECDLEAGNEGILRIRDEVGWRVKEAAEKEGRVFAIMYDVSGVPADRIQRIIERDWSYLVLRQGILDSPNYLREKGKPVVGLWGFGFEGSGHTPALVRAVTALIRNVTPGGAYIVGGAPAQWRSSEGDADRNPEFVGIWMNEFDAILPWHVNRFRTEQEADDFSEFIVKGDIELVKRHNEQGNAKKIDYIPVVFPGFSGYNLTEGRWGYNDAKRNGGRFLWKQIYNAKRHGARIMYGAMWDEYDEGTALMPVVENKRLLPESDRFAFMALDVDGYDTPSDWYMRICGYAAEGLRSERRIFESFPSKELQDYWGSRPKYEEVSAKAAEFISGSSHASQVAAGGSGGGDGQSYQQWLAAQRGEAGEELPPPPYTLEADESAPAPAPAPAPASAPQAQPSRTQAATSAVTNIPATIASATPPTLGVTNTRVTDGGPLQTSPAPLNANLPPQGALAAAVVNNGPPQHAQSKLPLHQTQPHPHTQAGPPPATQAGPPSSAYAVGPSPTGCAGPAQTAQAGPPGAGGYPYNPNPNVYPQGPHAHHHPHQYSMSSGYPPTAPGPGYGGTHPGGDPVGALANQFSQQKISGPIKQPISPPPLHPAHPAAQQQAQYPSHRPQSRPSTGFSGSGASLYHPISPGPSPQNPGSQLPPAGPSYPYPVGPGPAHGAPTRPASSGHPSGPSTPLSPVYPGGQWSQAQWPPQDWKANSPAPSQPPLSPLSPNPLQQGYFPPGPTHGGANLVRPGSFSANNTHPGGANPKPQASATASSAGPQSGPPLPGGTSANLGGYPGLGGPYPGSSSFPQHHRPDTTPPFTAGPTPPHQQAPAGGPYPGPNPAPASGRPQNPAAPSPYPSTGASQQNDNLSSYYAAPSQGPPFPSVPGFYPSGPGPSPPSTISYPSHNQHQGPAGPPYGVGFPQVGGTDGGYYNQSQHSQFPITGQGNSHPYSQSPNPPPGASAFPSATGPPRPSSSANPGSSGGPAAFPLPVVGNAGASALNFALNAVDKYAGKKTRLQLESGVGHLAQSGSKLFGKFGQK